MKTDTTEQTLTAREVAWILDITEPGLAYRRKNGPGPRPIEEEDGEKMTYREADVIGELQAAVDRAQADLAKGKVRLASIKNQR